ncbi:24-hydroxycholesterol 7-alpha-hydroxylase isoform X3 [Brienomyrus brachyistius]|uniref:24-hydroxycholesterol 7-alpha-hydroxylase isoform X3 n=1 Tax=Brienomyrus brachyistius TaxID=42636 RepID=UPI0020B1FE81|nr:24-hydroxycholesterol 7-alpha-hydroxylase isoform X3 [Brienomyrus brachyistius]
MDLIILFLCLLILFSSGYVLFLQKKVKYPPCITGWIPWFGAAFQFGKAPLDFIAQARAKYGPVFTVFAAGKRLTFVTCHKDFRTFFTSKDVDFEQAVQEPVYHTASISKESFYRFHPACNPLIKGKLTQAQAQLSGHLCEEFNTHLALLGRSGSGELCDLVRAAMYPAVISNLLGKRNSPNSPAAVREFIEMFRTYDEGFEHGSQLPDIFLRDWAKSKQWLLSLLNRMVMRARGSEPSETLLQRLMATVTDRFLPNYALLMLWASLANAIPITFWAVAFILSHPSAYQKAMEQISTALKDQSTDRTSVSAAELQRTPYVKCCILEAIRLRAPGAITRRVVRPLQIQNYIIPPGDLLMLSPYWAHRNPQFFPDPEEFWPERWEKADLEKNVFLEGFVAFGGGRNQCPGSPHPGISWDPGNAIIRGLQGDRMAGGSLRCSAQGWDKKTIPSCRCSPGSEAPATDITLLERLPEFIPALRNM